MSGPYASGKHALGICDRCGFTYKLKELRAEFVKHRDTGLLVCSECWDPSHPQLDLGDFPIYDPQALENARPDNAEYAQSRAIYEPVSGSRGFCLIGQVSVTT